MKKLVMVMLMAVMVATPCLAQEVETVEVFSLHGTRWEALPIGVQIFPFPFVWPTDDLQFGFYGGGVYPNLEFDGSSSYRDMSLFSIFSTRNSLLTHQVGGARTTSYFGILQPIGIGMAVEDDRCPGCGRLWPIITIALLIKTDDHWTPPEVE